MVLVTRLDVCKERFETKRKDSEFKHLELLYQELVNYLPTYKEKKEFSVYFENVKKSTNR